MNRNTSELQYVELRSREEFERNPNAFRSFPTIGNPLGSIGAFLGAYCAGMQDRATEEEVYVALLAEPTEKCEANATIRWLLGSLPISGMMELVSHCGISIGRIADHIRARHIHRIDLIRCLNQFAVPDRAGSEST